MQNIKTISTWLAGAFWFACLVAFGFLLGRAMYSVGSLHNDLEKLNASYLCLELVDRGYNPRDVDACGTFREKIAK